MSDIPYHQQSQNENMGDNNEHTAQQQFHNNTNPFLEDVTDQRNRNVPSIGNDDQIQAGQQEENPRSSSPSSSRSHSSRSSQEEEEKWEYESIKEGEQQGEENQVDVGDGIAPKQAMKEKSQHTIRYKYCCKKCKHADRDKNQKACVCVVPRDQRRTHLGNQGCQTCGCNGCSKEDFIFRGQDPEYHPEDKKRESKRQEQERFEARNGCCKNCMKAFSKSGKSCICQVPDQVRKTKLSTTGCKICGCTGCNPQDKKTHSKPQQRRTQRSRSRSERRRQKHSRRSHSRQNRQKKRRSKSRSPEIIDTFAMNFHNIDRSIIGSMIINEYQIDPALLGFGIPQRSAAYLGCKGREK